MTKCKKKFDNYWLSVFHIIDHLISTSSNAKRKKVTHQFTQVINSRFIYL